MVEFVSYTGKYPNLCSGILTLKINGVIAMFGRRYYGYKECQKMFPQFWVSGACGNFHETEKWEYDGGLPSFLKRYKDEIMRVFNENVPHGCCGGCL